MPVSGRGTTTGAVAAGDGCRSWVLWCCNLQGADVQTGTLLLSSVSHPSVHLESVLQDAYALTAFNNNVLSPPAPLQNQTLPCYAALTSHGGTDPQTSGCWGCSCPTPPHPSHRDPYPGCSGARPSRGHSSTALLHGRSGHRGGSRRLAGTPVHKIHQDRLGKQRRNPHNTPIQRAGDLSAEEMPLGGLFCCCNAAPV